MTRSWRDAAEASKTLVEVLRRRAEEQPEALAYNFLADGEEPADRLAFGQLEARARAIAGALSATLGEGNLRGARALLLYPSGVEFVEAFLGCLYAGIIAVPAYPPASRRHLPRLQSIARDAAPAVVLADAPSMPKIRAAAAALPELEDAAWLATDEVDTDELATKPGDAWNGQLPKASDLAFLQYTSGSTAAPKGVMVSHGNLMHNEAVIQRQTGHSESTVFVGWLPLYHDMGLIGNILQPLYLGIPCHLMSPVAFLQRPLRWLEAISRYGGTTSGGPNFAYELCLRKISDNELAELDLSSWSLAFSGAEPVRAATLERFADRFAACGFRREALYPCYGMAETTLMITGGEREAQPVLRAFDATALEAHRAVPVGEARRDGGTVEIRNVVGCGTAGLDFDLRIVDPETMASLDDGRIGEIWVASPSVAQGYWNLPEVTKRDFGAHTLDGDGPFLRTGDLGFLDGGELFVTGRLKDLIIIRGRNHYPQDLEHTAETSHPSLRPGCGVAVADTTVDAGEAGDGEERLVIVHEIHRHAKDDPEAIADAIRRAVAEGHQVQVHDVVLIRQGTLPKTSSGKLQRRAALADYREDRLTTVGRSTMDADAEEETAAAELELNRDTLLARARRRPLLESYLRARFARLTRSATAAIDPDRPLTSFGLDSLVAVELRNTVESRFGIDVSLPRLLEGLTIAELTSNILTELDRGTAPEAANRPILNAGSAEDRREHPVSYGQRALWYLHRLAPDQAAYNIRGAARVHGDLDPEALRHAAEALVKRHPSLRTRFVQEADDPVALVVDTNALDWSFEDASSLGDSELEAQLLEMTHRPFDLENGPLLRLGVLRRTPREHLLVLTVHHIIADFWSLGVLLRELGAVYGSRVSGEASVELEPLPLTYADFAHWQHALLEGPAGERLWSFWRSELGGELPLLDLPTDRPRPAVQTFAGDSRVRGLDAELQDRLEHLARQHGATVYMVLLSLFQTLLHRWSGQTELLVGTPTTQRVSTELENVVGYFVNPVVIRGRFDGRPSFESFLDRLRQAVLGAFAHQEYPFPLLAERLRPEHDPSRSPIFQVLFTWQKDRRPEEEGLAAFSLGESGVEIDLGPLVAESVKLPDQSAQFDLALEMARIGDRLAASLGFNTDLFDAATAERLLAQLETLLRAALEAPSTSIADLPILPDAERRQLLVEWNEPVLDTPRELLHEPFVAQAARTPEATALVGNDAPGGRRITYRHLDRAANRLAHRLRGLGVGPEVPVGICTERATEMILGLLGILKAGGVYVPLDPAYPEKRLAFTLEDSQVAALLVDGGKPTSLPELDVPMIDLAEHPLSADDDQQADAPPPSTVAPENMAYLIYTSGSTGRPKGVAMTHGSAAVLVRWASQVFPPDAFSGTLLATSICFDLSVFEIFVTLGAGGKAILAQNALELPELEAAGEVTLVNTVPSAMAELVAPPDAEHPPVSEHRGLPPGVKIVNLAGEPLPRELVQAIYCQPGVERVYNLYGPSEDTTYSTFTWVRRDDPRSPSIGRPVAGTQAYVTDRGGQLVPRGVPGELLLGGAGLARGYLGRPAQTAERFVPSSFTDRPGVRLYRTGDLVRHRRDGELEFLGRLDHQVKVRGFRIELGEIETALEAQAEIRESLVVAHLDDPSRPGDRRIVAYLVPESGTPDLHALREALGEALPAFMIPEAFVVLDAFPLLPNGKIDRKSLPAPDAGETLHDREFVEPQTEVERLLAEIWEEILGVEKVGVTDHFFDLGGHSLKATRVLSRVRQLFNVDLPVRALLEKPTILGLTEAIAEELLAGADEETVAELLGEEE